MLRNALIAALLLAGLLTHPQPARAAQSYDNCKGFITSLPTTISTQGVWCLKGDLSTAITSGAAIEITTNNVTLDCNDFKLGGLAAGSGSQAYGVYAYNRQNATVRHCNIRGFYVGVALSGSSGAGNLVEDNRLDNNLYTGISVDGDHGLMQRNRVFDTGGSTGNYYSYGIRAAGYILDNIVDGVFVDKPGAELYGITTIGANRVRVSGNTVSNLSPTTAGGGLVGVMGIRGANSGLVRGNAVFGPGSTYSVGISENSSTASCRDNTVIGFVTVLQYCSDDGGNVNH
jgi:hypothetical protein